jgi:hypothetical protein
LVRRRSMQNLKQQQTMHAQGGQRAAHASKGMRYGPETETGRNRLLDREQVHILPGLAAVQRPAPVFQGSPDYPWKNLQVLQRLTSGRCYDPSPVRRRSSRSRMSLSTLIVQGRISGLPGEDLHGKHNGPASSTKLSCGIFSIQTHCRSTGRSV